MKTFLNITLALAVSAGLVSCFDKTKPNYQYFPDMYEPVSYQTNGAYSIFPQEQSSMLPAEGSIPRGWEPYDYEDTYEELLRAKEELKNPLEVNEKNLTQGAQLFNIYCAVCHGGAGDGKGILPEREKFLGVPSFDDPGRVITPGGTFHVQTYGLNAMGSYSSQLDTKERWQVAMHVMDLKAALKGEPGVLETAKAEPVSVKETINNSEEETASDNSNDE